MVRGRGWCAALLAAAAILLVAAATAMAAQVRVIVVGGPGEGEGIYDATATAIKPVGGRITAPSTFKCNSANLIVKAKSIKLKGGKLNYSGPAYVDFFRAPKILGTLTWKGTPTKGTIRFQAKKSVKPNPKGGVKIVTKACDTGTLKFKLR